jgi:outer membrane immunogenic protein
VLFALLRIQGIEMKRLALALTSMAAFAGSAVAADLSARTYTKAPAPVAAVMSWTGCYVGGQVGYKSASTNQSWANSGNVALLPDGTPLTGTLRPDGAVGGVTAGCNYQFAANWVIGAEGDYSWTDLSSSARLLPPANTLHTFEVKESSFATARARLGYAVDQWLFFVSGGAAWARVDISDSNIPTGGTLFQSVGQTYSGWTVGGGVEYAVTRNWLVKAEYLYADLGSNRVQLRNALGGDADVSLKQQLGRFGVNYKF